MKHAPNAPKQEANEKCNGMNGGGEKAQHGYVSDEAQMLVCVCVCVWVGVCFCVCGPTVGYAWPKAQSLRNAARHELHIFQIFEGHRLALRQAVVQLVNLCVSDANKASTQDL